MTRNRFKRFIPVTRLERYVLRELWLTFGVTLGALTFLMMLRFLVEPVREGIPAPFIIRYLPLMFPYALSWTVPTAFVVACVMTYSRMAEANELTALRASGGHLWRVLSPAAMSAVLLVAMCGVLNHHVVPKTRFDQYAQLRGTAAWEQVAAITLGEPVIDIGRNKVYIRRVNPDDSFEGVVIVFEQRLLPSAGDISGKQQRTYLKAPRGRFEFSDAEGLLVFYLEGERPAEGQRDPLAGKGEMYRIPEGAGPLEFERAYYGQAIIPIPLRDMSQLVFVPQRGRHMTSGTLFRKAAERRREIADGVRKPPDPTDKTSEGWEYAMKRWQDWADQSLYWLTEAHKRSALALAPLLLAAIAVPLGIITRRGRKLVAFALGICVVLGIFYPLLGAATKLGTSGVISPAVSIWGMLGLMAAAGLILNTYMLRR